MNMTFDASIKEQITTMIDGKPVDLVLDFDHTLSHELAESKCCGITRYRIVIADKNSLPDEFDGQFDSELGTFHCKAWGMMYFDEYMNVRKTDNGLTQIMGAGELIAPNIEIVDYRK
ncbi:MAG: iron-sulfur cluster biosynthesis family protein [Streptococcaceae bacterium]|nr:iron-sulfur cluster biosynthesis family protein [Streptococcaceae bacterium]